MADYNHRRAASELLAYRQVSGGAVYGQDRFSVSQRPGSAGTLFAHPTPRGHHMVDQNGSKYANTNFHYRSQSYESPCGWDAYVEGEPVSALPAGHCRYGSLGPAEARTQHGHLAPPNSQRRGSESSTSSAISNYTAATEAPSTWSASTTPEAMSPTSPNNSLLLQSPPESMPSKASLATQALPPSPSKVPHQTFVPGRTARARAFSHSAPKGFQNTVIESSVPEEDEQTEAARNWNKAHQNNASHGNMVKQPALPYVGMTEDEAKAVSNLRQRRQQRQLKIAGKPHSKQPVRLRLSPMPPLPLPQQGLQAHSAPSPRALKASRSSPQLRDAVGPPPIGPLPPLPGAPELSKLLPPTPRTPAMPPTPSFANNDARPPHPTMPPPPPPSRPPIDSPSPIFSPTMTSPLMETKPHEESQPQGQGSPWEEELRRHKKLLEQFPAESEARYGVPKLSRSHRSLGNIRARSRSLSRAAGAAFYDDAAIAGPRLSHRASSFSLRGSNMQRPSTAKASQDVEIRAPKVQPSQSSGNAPQCSVFEDDSDEEGDTVRKFVRNLFTRRTRNGEMPMVTSSTTEQAREVPSSSKHSMPSTKPRDTNGHNDRKTNHSASSNFSIATTVGASTVFSTTTTLDPSSADACHYGCGVECPHEGGISSSPRSSSDHSRHHQKGPLLSRMFVRRSH